MNETLVSSENDIAAPATSPVVVEFSDAERIENLRNLSDVKMTLSAVLGRAVMPVNQFLKLGRGAVVSLDKKKDQDVDLEINGQPIAMGDIMLIEDRIAVKVTETNYRTIKALRKKP